MNIRRCLEIAERIEALLLRELGEGVDGLRMATDALYARDVLLVCDALPGIEAAALAQQFRFAAGELAAAAASQDVPPAAPAQAAAPRVERPRRAAAPADETDADSESPGTEAGSARRWFSPSRWLIGR